MGACECGTVCLCPARFTPGGDFNCRMGRVVDRAREVAAQMGLRPYRVSFVHVRWTGRKKGDGVEEVVTQRDILPAPLIADLSGITRTMSAAQIEEAGSVLIDKISAYYSEDQILCRPATGKPLPENEAIYYEVQLGNGDRRRLVPVGTGVPTFKAVTGWSVLVSVQSGGRARNGATR